MQLQGRQRPPSASVSLHRAFQQHMETTGAASSASNVAASALLPSAFVVGREEKDLLAPPAPLPRVQLDAAALIPPYHPASALSQQLQAHRLGEDAQQHELASAGAASEPLAGDAYFSASALAALVSPSDVSGSPRALARLAVPPRTDAGALFDPASSSARYTDKVQLLGGRSYVEGEQGQQAVTHALRGSKLRSSYRVEETIPRRASGSSSRPGSAIGSRPASASIAAAATSSSAAPLPTSLTGMPLSFFGVSDQLSRGQRAIQQRWLANVGLSPDDAPPTSSPLPLDHTVTDGPMSPRKSYTRTGDMPAATEIAASTKSTDGEEPAQGAAHVPRLNLPVQPWQPELSAPKPGAHTHETLPLQSFALALPAGHVPRAGHVPLHQEPQQHPQRPGSGRASRPTSSTSRSQRLQQAASAAAAASSSRPTSAVAAAAPHSRPSTAGRRIASVGPIAASQSYRLQGHTPTFREGGGPESENMGVRGVGAGSDIGEDASVAAVPAPAARPSSAVAQRLSAQQQQAQPFTPSNLYARYTSEEKEKEAAAVRSEDEGEADGDAFETEYQRFRRAQAQQQHALPAPSGARTARPVSGVSARAAVSSRPVSSTSRPQSGRSLTARANSSRPSSAARGLSVQGGLLHFATPAQLVRVSTRGEKEQHFLDRQKGLLLTTRARPPFAPGSLPKGSGGHGGNALRSEFGPVHSSDPSHPAALRPNAGFSTELAVSLQLLGEFQRRTEAERVHFYSPHLFWEYKLEEMLRATQGERLVTAPAPATARRAGPPSTQPRVPAYGANLSHAIREEEATANLLAAAANAPILPSSDHVYPNTFRTLATSYILQQVLPMLTAPKQAHTANGDEQQSLNASPATKSLLHLCLGVLHRSIYQEDFSRAVLPPPPPAHMLDPSLSRRGASVEEEALAAEEMQRALDGAPAKSKRARRLAAIAGSGYGQAPVSSSSEATPRLAIEDLDALDEDNDDPVSSRDPMPTAAAAVAPSKQLSAPLPYFLSLKYLYESLQIELGQTETLSARVKAVENQASRILVRGTAHGLRLSFRAWRSHVKAQKNKVGLAATLARKSVSRGVRASPKVIFLLWRDWVCRGRMRRGYRATLRSMGSEVRSISSHLDQNGHRDARQLQAYLSEVTSSLRALESESALRSQGAAIDVFSPLAFSLLLDRLLAQLEHLASVSAAGVNLLPLCPTYSLASAPSTEVDALLLEAGRLDSSDVLSVKKHLIDELALLRSREEAHERGMLDSLAALSGEEFLKAWCNAHLRGPASGAAGGKGWVLRDLDQLALHTDMYVELMESVAPGLLESVGGNAKQSQAMPVPAIVGGSNALSAPLPLASSAAEAEQRMLSLARSILEAAAQLGCVPVMSLEEFVAHPSHAGHMARLAAEKRASGGGSGGSRSERRGGLADGSVFSSVLNASSTGSAYTSAHPADAGLAPNDQGANRDARGRGAGHMFDDLALESDAPSAKGTAKSSVKSPPRGSGRSIGGGAQRPFRTAAQLLATIPPSSRGQHADPMLASNPHLHLCLLASLFLQRPALPSASGAGGGSGGAQTHVVSDAWVSDARARIESLRASWADLQKRAEASPAEVLSFLSGVEHIGLEIDVLLARAQRRAESLRVLQAKMEDLLWTLQKRKNGADGAAVAGSGASVAANSVSGALARTGSLLREGAPEYTEIPLGKLLDLLGSSPAERSGNGGSLADTTLEQYIGLKQLLGRHYADLANIYRHYASLGFNSATASETSSSGGGARGNAPIGGCMSFAEFNVLLSDCHLSRVASSAPGGGGAAGGGGGVLHALFTRSALSLRELSMHSAHLMPHTDADRLAHAPLGLGARPNHSLTGGGSISSAAQVAAFGGEAGSLLAHSGDKISQLTLNQPSLFEALIRLAQLKYPSAPDLVERTRRLLEMDVLPRARRLRMDDFRSRLGRDRVKHVFLAHRQELLAVFYHYATGGSGAGAAGEKDEDELHEAKGASVAAASANSSNGKGGRLLTQRGFMRLASEANLFTSPARGGNNAAGSGGQVAFAEKDLINILSAVLRVPAAMLHAQASAAVGTNASPSGALVVASSSAAPIPGADLTGLTFSEFLECLGALAAHRTPDPYLPLQVKVESFVRGILLPPLRAQIRRLNHIMSATGSGATSNMGSPAASPRAFPAPRIAGGV